MEIKAKDSNIENIFSGKKYSIPDYQRDYSWTVNEEISIFWDDFVYYIEENSDSNFFIGPMVFKGDSLDSINLEVIDGQQRLITLSILINVIISLFKKYRNNDLADGLQNSLIFKDKRTNKETLAIEAIEPHPYFQKRIFHNIPNVSPSKKSEKLMEKARNFFENKIEARLEFYNKEEKKIEDLEKIRDFIFEIDTVVIVSENESDAFTIFETINTRGKNLSSLDLLKNYIFKNSTDKVGVEEQKEKWKKLSENISIDRESFFNRFWASWISKTTESKLFRRFNDYVRNTENSFSNVDTLLTELLIASEIYRKIIKPEIDDWKINKNYEIYSYIKNINGLFALKIHFPFLLALFEEFNEKNIKLALFKETLQLIESFHFIFTHIVSPRASGLDNKYSKFAIKLRNETDKKKVIKELSEELFEKIPSYEEYLEKFKDLNYAKNKETIKFILLRLEKEQDPALNIIDFEENSIEHLSPKENKKLKNFDKIGNLFLLEKKYNEQKDNLKPFDSFSDSNILEFLKENTKYKSTKREFSNIIDNIKKWEDVDIQDRTEGLAKKTYKLFSNILIK